MPISSPGHLACRQQMFPSSETWLSFELDDLAGVFLERNQPKLHALFILKKIPQKLQYTCIVSPKNGWHFMTPVKTKNQKKQPNIAAIHLSSISPRMPRRWHIVLSHLEPQQIGCYFEKVLKACHEPTHW